MSAALGTWALAAAAGVAFAAATSVGLAVGWPLLRRLCRRRHPAARARIALSAALAPAVVPVVLVALCLAPGLLGLLGLHADHCVQHVAHPHLCLVHPAAMLTGPAALGMALPGLVLLGGLSLRLVRQGAAAHGSLRRLRGAASKTVAPRVRLVPSDRAFSLTAGLGRSEIFVSDALVAGLSPAHLAAVVAHERAHARNFDGLKRLAARVLSVLHLPPIRRSILAELELAMERACDEQAGQHVGDRLLVAEAILAAERLVASSPGRSPLLAFADSSVPARVHGLLAAPVADRRLVRGWVTGGLLVGGGLLGAEALHHATEHLLGLVLRAF